MFLTSYWVLITAPSDVISFILGFLQNYRFISIIRPTAEKEYRLLVDFLKKCKSVETSKKICEKVLKTGSSGVMVGKWNAKMLLMLILKQR